MIRETIENESADKGYKFGQKEITYNYMAGHYGFLGRLLIPWFASSNHRAFHFLLVAVATIGIWCAAVGVSTMAFNLNGFNFNQSILNSQVRVIPSDADILNRANLGIQSMHSPNTHHFPLILANSESTIVS